MINFGFKGTSILCGVLFTLTLTNTNAELWTGLPDSISLNSLVKSWVEFDHSTKLIAPLATQIVWNDQKVAPFDLEKRSQIFEEKTFAWFKNPADQIQVSLDSLQREVWNYPTGTIVAHLILILSQNPDISSRVFELRLIEKIGPKTWAFGSYFAINFGDTEFFLDKDPTLKPFELNYFTPAKQAATLKLKRISNSSCQNCHFMTSPSQYQFESAETAGPCEFGPASQEFKDSWIDRFKKLYGHSPF